MIVVVSGPGDQHAAAVMRSLMAAGREAVLLDLSDFPQRLAVALSYGGDGRDFRLLLPTGEIAASEIRAVWWRRPGAPSPHPEISRPEFQSFVFNESQEVLAGLWQTLDAWWMNPPANDEVAAHKVLQLAVAQEVGLAVPRTLITNEPSRAQAFVAELAPGRVIYKSFTATELAWRETRILRSEELPLLDSVRYAPVIFQEYVESGADVRVTIVDDQMFAAAIHSRDSSYEVDFRMDLSPEVRVEPIELPGSVATGLRRLMSRLGLIYGAVDLRRRPDGGYVFLEVNPSGQWLFIEERTGQRITEYVAAKLTEHGRPT